MRKMSATIGLTKLTLTREIADYVQKCGGVYSRWYCGITADPPGRLFGDHNVDRNGVWIYRTFDTSDEARAIEAHFLELGMKGGGGGGDWTAKVVYAYLITNTTRE
jgi:hypothetical protein